MKIKTSFRIKPTQLFFTLVILFFLVCMLCNPAKFMQCSLNGISAWAFNVLPSVLPFMFFTKILSALDVMPMLTRPFSPVTSKLFKTPPISIYTFAMAVLSGYPVGTKMVADLYAQGVISKEEAFKMTSFCSTSGPMFIIGAVGVGMFANTKIGYILFVSHLLGAILNGLCFRSLKIKSEQIEKGEIKEKQPFNLAEIVTSATLAILSVGCIIAIFFIVIECFAPLLSFLPKPLAAMLEGCLEITKGCLDISKLSNLPLAIVMSSFVISFGGVSTILQSITMLSSLKMPVKLFVFQKFLHGVFSAAITILILLIL